MVPTECATSSGDASIKLWDIENSCPTQEFQGHTSDVMAISECSVEYFGAKQTDKLLLSASTDGSCKVWDHRINEANDCVHSYFMSKADLNCCAWFPDGQCFAAGSEDGTIRLIDIRTHRQLNQFETEMNAKTQRRNAVHSICFSRSGYFLFAGTEGDGHCQTWKTATAQERVPLQHEQRVTSIKIAPNGQQIATSSWDSMVRIWG